MTDTLLYLREDTIAAPSTPPGRGAVAVLRLSGPDALVIARRIFHPSHTQHPLPARRMVYGAIIDPAAGERIDDVMCVVFPAPSSYTGEHVVEIHCHGSEAVVRKILELVCREGARPAEPGEFTFRAVRNGKMDLAQAEAVAALVDSRSQLARTLSLRMLEGEFSTDLAALREEIVSVLIEIETQIEFPDDAMEEELGQHLERRLETLRERASALQKRAVREQRFEQGIIVVLTGRPNVGKSSLFNRLLGRERAIVSPHPGTTRDSIEGTIELEGRPVTLIDTAGLRETREEIESIGIQRSHELLSTSHLILFICEAVHGLTGEDYGLLETIAHLSKESRVIIVGNKVDLAGQAAASTLGGADLSWPVVYASAVQDKGLNDLLAVMEHEVKRLIPDEAESAYLVSARQERFLRQLIERIDQASVCIQERSPLELPAEDLRAALRIIAELDGSGIAPDVMSLIFSRFCIGK